MPLSEPARPALSLRWNSKTGATATLQQLAEECQIEVKDLHFYHCFRYNLRFSAAAVKRDLPGQLNRLQGFQHIWYSGGLLSHWDVSSIYEYNRWLVNKMHYQMHRKTIGAYLRYLYRSVLGRLRLI